MCCRLRMCCDVIELRLGTLIIAGLSLLGDVGVLAFTSVLIQLSREVLQDLREQGIADEGNLTISGKKGKLAILSMVLFVSIVDILLNVMLFFGAKNRRRDMLLVWLCGHAAVSGVYLLYFWEFVVMLVFAADIVLVGLMALLATIVAAALTVYFSIVVHSYDLTLREQYNAAASGACGSAGNGSCASTSAAEWPPYNADVKFDPPPPYPTLLLAEDSATLSAAST